MRDKAPTSIISIADDLDGAPMDGLQWLINAPKTGAIAIDERGFPVEIPTARRPDRSAVKAIRDWDQSEAGALIARRYFNLPLDGDYLAGLPAPLREAAVSTLALDGPSGLSKDAPTEPDW